MVENGKKKHPIIHCPTSEGVSEVSERASAAEGASEASSPEQANEWAVRANERTDERVAQYLRLYSCLFQTTVPWSSLNQSINYQTMVLFDLMLLFPERSFCFASTRLMRNKQFPGEFL